MPAPSRLAMGGMHATYALSESARYATEQAEKERAKKAASTETLHPAVGTRLAVVTDMATGGHYFDPGSIVTVIEAGFKDERFFFAQDEGGVKQFLQMSDVVPVC